MKIYYILLALVFVIVPIAYSLSMLDLAPRGFVYVPPSNVNMEAAQGALRDAQNAIDDMEAANLSVTFVEDALHEAQLAFNDGNFENVFKLSQLIIYVRTEGQLLNDEMSVFERELKGSSAAGHESETADAFYRSAVMALSEARYDDSRDALVRAQIELKQAVAEFERTSKLHELQEWFFVRYKWHLALSIMAGVGVSFPLVRSFRSRNLRNKILRMRDDRERTEQLIVELQKRCFIEKKMMPSAYRQKATQYEEHLAELKRTLPVLEAQLERTEEKP